jgi:dolichyl-diphosphooligosaccharide--protein glycosyltransferase
MGQSIQGVRFAVERPADQMDTPLGSAPALARCRRLELPRTLRIAIPVGLFLSALAVRAVTWRSVYQGEGVHPFGYDAFYHLRRIQYSVANFPAVLNFDPFINFPHGAQPIWPPTFDWLLAAVFRLVLGSDQPERLERIAMWLPPLLGAATVVLLYFLALRLSSRVVAFLAAGILCILPAHFYYSQLGFLDHHVAVALLATLMLVAAMDLLREGSSARTQAGGFALRQSVLLGLTMAGAVLLWPGSLLHVGIVQLALVARLLSASDPSAAVAWARRFALVHLVACAAVLPLSAGNEWLLWGRFSPVVLSNFQPLYFGAAAVGFALLGELWRRGWLCADRGTRALAGGLWGAALLGLLLAMVPELRSGLVDAWAWFAKEEEFQSVVSESAPLFAPAGRFDVAFAVETLGAVVYAVPIAVVYLAWKARRRADRLVFFWWTLALFAATLIQWRFMNSYAVAHSLLLALTLKSLHEDLAPHLIRRRGVAWAAASLGLVGVLYACSPWVHGYRPHLVNLWRGLRGEAPQPVGVEGMSRLVVTTARWLRENSPPPEGQGYSVLGPWGDGHILKYVAQRPVVQDNFGDDVAAENFELAEEYFSARSEQVALDLIEKVGARYVLVRSTGSGRTHGYANDSQFAQLFHSRGTRAEGREGGRRIHTPSLQRHRLIYESPPFAGRPGAGRSFCKLYEVVAGARLVGLADPGAVVRVRLGLETRHGGRFEYTATSRADSAGRYGLRLPYPNESFSPDVRVDEQYRLRSGETFATASISEEAVRGGHEVAGPSLRKTAAAEHP